jgi:hypothetical protein
MAKGGRRVRGAEAEANNEVVEVGSSRKEDIVSAIILAICDV